MWYNSVGQRAEVGSVKVIPADEALDAFRKDSGFGTALDALTDNPLPHVIEVRPTESAATPADLEVLKRHLATWPEVDLVHCSMNGLSSLVGMTAKWRH